MYHVKVKSLADVGDTDSDFTMAYLVRTGVATDEERVTHFQTWLTAVQGVNQQLFDVLPDMEDLVLSSADRKRLNGSGVRRYGYIDKISDTAMEYPQFWPSFVENTDELKELIREIEVLRNLAIVFRHCARISEDRLLIVGDDAFRLANTYYRTVHDAARSGVPEAEQVLRMIELFWQRRRKASAEPTAKETLRNFKGLMNGTREGEMFIGNESDSFTKGKRTVIDKTRKKQRNNFKEMETGSADFSEDAVDSEQ